MRILAGRLTTLLTVLAVVTAVAVVGFLGVAPRIVGGATLTVLTGSMSPTIPAGSVVLIRPVEDPLAVAPGTVITFQKSPTERVLVTHRVVEFQPDTTPPSYVTKGDANRGTDRDPVPVGAIRGEVIAHVPHLGKAATLLGGTRGPYLLGLAVGLLFIASQVRRLIGAIRDDGTTPDPTTDPTTEPDDPATRRPDATAAPGPLPHEVHEVTR